MSKYKKAQAADKKAEAMIQAQEQINYNKKENKIGKYRDEG